MNMKTYNKRTAATSSLRRVHVAKGLAPPLGQALGLLCPKAGPHCPPDPAPIARGGRPAHSEVSLPLGLRAHAQPRDGGGASRAPAAPPPPLPGPVSPARGGVRLRDRGWAGPRAPIRPSPPTAPGPIPPARSGVRLRGAGSPAGPQPRGGGRLPWGPRAPPSSVPAPRRSPPRRGGRPRPSPLPSRRPAGAAAVTRERRRRSQDVADGHVRDLR